MKKLSVLISAVILSFALAVSLGFAQTSVTKPTQVIPQPIASSSGFGRTVDIDGTRAIVEDDSGVYIYDFSNDRWNLTTNLFLSLPIRFGGSFTGSVALDGNTAAVQYGINSSIMLAVFELRNGVWFHVAAFELPFSANASNSTNPLAVSGNTIVIGVQDFDGKAHVYEKIDNEWTFVTELNSPEVESDVPPVFARDLDVTDDTIVIRQTSIDLDLNLNAVLYFYKKLEGNWLQQSRLPVVKEEYGLGATHKVVSLSTNRLIVAVREGVVVYDLVNGNWTEAGFIGPGNLATDPNNQSWLNESINTVSLDSTGTQAALGSTQGRVFLFQFVNGQWIESEIGTNNNPLRFGESVAIDREHLMAGSRGGVYYYRLNQTSSCIDTDGDGFGWNGTNTCTPTETITGDNQPQLLQCLDTDGDGFGWNGVQTCIPDGGVPPVIDQSFACIDTDGDGFGWNGVDTCIPDRSDTQPVIDPSFACTDIDGDGFGWNGIETCIPDGEGPSPVADQSLVCIDSDGDGYGWTGTQSCRVDEQGNIVIL